MVSASACDISPNTSCHKNIKLKMASEMEMARVLRKLNLELFIEKFNMEKITPDLVGKLSLNEFEKLGVQNMVQRKCKEESQISVRSSV